LANSSAGELVKLDLYTWIGKFLSHFFDCNKRLCARQIQRLTFMLRAAKDGEKYVKIDSKILGALFKT